MPIEWTETPVNAKPKEGDGEPCPHCGTRLPRLEVKRTADGALLVGISYKIPKNMVSEEVEGISRLLQMFVRGIGSKSKPKRKQR